MSVDLEKREKQEVSNTAAERMNWSGAAYSPDVDIYASEDEVLFAVDLPGVNKGDVNIQVDETDTLVIRAKNSHKDAEGAALRQYRIGDYYRAFQISDDYDKDKVQAKLENGLLQIVVPKKESAKPKRIEITAQQGISPIPHGPMGPYLRNPRPILFLRVSGERFFFGVETTTGEYALLARIRPLKRSRPLIDYFVIGIHRRISAVLCRAARPLISLVEPLSGLRFPAGRVSGFRTGLPVCLLSHLMRQARKSIHACLDGCAVLGLDFFL